MTDIVKKRKTGDEMTAANDKKWATPLAVMMVLSNGAFVIAVKTVGTTSRSEAFLLDTLERHAEAFDDRDMAPPPSGDDDKEKDATKEKAYEALAESAQWAVDCIEGAVTGDTLDEFSELFGTHGHTTFDHEEMGEWDFMSPKAFREVSRGKRFTVVTHVALHRQTY
jgi:hypothetical protein